MFDERVETDLLGVVCHVRECPDCQGYGRLELPHPPRFGQSDSVACGRCDGHGEIWDDSCVCSRCMEMISDLYGEMAVAS
jgi:DnaJ-class molecular chaperone